VGSACRMRTVRLIRARGIWDRGRHASGILNSVDKLPAQKLQAEMLTATGTARRPASSIPAFGAGLA